MPALQPGATHACPYPFDDEVAFQLGDRSDDDDDGPAERAAGIDALPEADELDAETIEFVQHFKEVPDGPGDPVRGPHQDNIEAAMACVGYHLIEPGPPGLRVPDPVGELGYDLVITLGSHLPEVMQLRLRMLIEGRYPHL